MNLIRNNHFMSLNNIIVFRPSLYHLVSYGGLGIGRGAVVIGFTPYI